MGALDNKLLNYVGAVDVAVLFTCDCDVPPSSPDLPVVTPYELLFALFLLPTGAAWDGSYPLGVERMRPVIETLLSSPTALELLN